MKRFEVVLTSGARRDLHDIHAYLAEQAAPGKADGFLQHLLQTLESLATQPGRGTVPQELRSLGVRTFRQVLHKPYRIIYRLADKQVFVHVIADGRRDMQALLATRLLRV